VKERIELEEEGSRQNDTKDTTQVINGRWRGYKSTKVAKADMQKESMKD